jgi:membrane fusion protein, multidrug efflux system
MTDPRTPLLVLSILVAACGSAGAEEPASNPSTPVRMAAVEHVEIGRPVLATGTLHAKDELHLSFRSPGIVTRVLVAEGAAVRRGALLAALDPGDIDAQVARARSGLARADRDLARAEALFRDSVVTLQQVQDARTAAELARADVSAAEFSRRHASIVAPADGVVLRRLVEGGELVAPGATVLVLGSRERGVVLRVGVADRDALRLRPGDPATVSFDALSGRTFAGAVREIAPSADAGTGTYRVEITIDPGETGLSSGLVGRVEIRPGRTARMPTIPIAALLEADGDRGTVYTVSPAGLARRLPVAVGSLRDGRVAVPEGLDGVELVVTDGAAYLRDGAPVEVVP